MKVSLEECSELLAVILNECESSPEAVSGGIHSTTKVTPAFGNARFMLIAVSEIVANYFLHVNRLGGVCWYVFYKYFWLVSWRSDGSISTNGKFLLGSIGRLSKKANRLSSASSELL